MPHPSEHSPAVAPLKVGEVEELVDTLRALAAPSRFRLLLELQHGERTVEDLAAAAELSPSATSHNLRLLRGLRLVATRREGRHIWYSLHDHHIADLLAAVRHHHEHVHPPAPAAMPARRESARA